MIFRKYSVISAERATPSSLVLSLRAANPERPFTYQPGQYAAIQFRRRGRPTPVRCFSITTSPSDPGILQFGIRVKGHFTQSIAELKPGDTVKVRGPFGGFTLDESLHQKVVLLAGGIGITPFMSMVRYAAKVGLDTDITLFFSCQNQDDVPFGEELIALQRQNPHFKVVFVLGSGETTKFMSRATVATGRRTPELISDTLGGVFAGHTYYLCGPPGFMMAMRSGLTAHGVADGDILTEAFSQGPNRQTAISFNWPLHVYALTGLGLAFGAAVVMVQDLIKTLPPLSTTAKPAVTVDTSAASQRQAELLQAINDLQTALANPTASASNTTTTSPTATTPTPTNTVTTAPTPAQVATPAPAPVTSPSRP